MDELMGRYCSILKTLKKMKFLLLLCLMFLSTVSIGQDFPGEMVNLIQDKTVKPIILKKEFERYGYKNFYSKFNTDSKKLEKFKKNHRAFPIGISSSSYNKLVGKEFKVINIYEETPERPSDYGRHYIFELYNSDLGTIYYEYDSKYESSFELEVVGGLDIPEDFYCQNIKTSTDKFTGKVISKVGPLSGISFAKITENSYSIYSMFVFSVNPTLNVDISGLIILFDNGERIERPDAEIEVDVYRTGDYIYSTYIELTKSDIELIVNNKITDRRLYLYDSEIDSDHAKRLSEYLKCLLSDSF